MVDEVNRRKNVFKEQHLDATEEEIVESVQSQQIEVLGRVVRGMRRASERDLSHSSNNASTSRSRGPPRVNKQQLLEL